MAKKSAKMSRCITHIQSHCTAIKILLFAVAVEAKKT